jgi:hypothetical protein
VTVEIREPTVEEAAALAELLNAHSFAELERRTDTWEKRL